MATLGNLNLTPAGTSAATAATANTPAAALSCAARVAAAARPAVAGAGMTIPAASQTHSSGLPTQPPAGISPQLWSSVLQHLQSTNFGQPQQRAPAASAPAAACMKRPAAPVPAPVATCTKAWRPLPSPSTQPISSVPFI